MTQKEVDDFMGRLTGKTGAPDPKLKGGNAGQERANDFCRKLAGQLPPERASETLTGLTPSADRTPVFHENTGRQTDGKKGGRR